MVEAAVQRKLFDGGFGHDNINQARATLWLEERQEGRRRRWIRWGLSATVASLALAFIGLLVTLF